MEPTQTQNKSNGALIGSVIIILIIIIGGIYLWQTSVKEKAAQPSDDTSSAAANVDAEMNNMDFDNLDQGVN